MENLNELANFSKNLNILFIEDNIEVKEQLQKLLSNFFSNITVASDGYEAIIKYKEYYSNTNNYFDIVITDLNLPKIHGFELCEQILHMNDKQLILVISAHTESDKLEKLAHIGINSFLQKPIDYMQFIKTISKLVNTIKNQG